MTDWYVNERPVNRCSRICTEFSTAFIVQLRRGIHCPQQNHFKCTGYPRPGMFSLGIWGQIILFCGCSGLIGCLATTLNSSHEMPHDPNPHTDSQQCVQTLSNVPWVTKSPLVENCSPASKNQVDEFYSRLVESIIEYRFTKYVNMISFLKHNKGGSFKEKIHM